MPKPKSMSHLDNQEPSEALVLDPLIKALLEHLPASGSDWAKTERQKWLTILSQSFELIYKEPSTGEPNNPAQNVR